MIPDEVRAELSRPPEEVVIAIVGATDEPSKYGSIIFADLSSKGYRPIPVNPNRATVDGVPTVATISDIPQGVDIAVVVVPPQVARQVVEDLPDGKVATLWFQPGAFDARTLQLAARRSENVVYGDCIMVETRAG